VPRPSPPRPGRLPVGQTRHLAATSSPGRGLCLYCRTLLEPGQPCDGGRGHPVAPIEPPDAREPILRAVWGPPDARLRARQLIKAGGSGAGFGLLYESCQSCTPDLEGALLVAIIGLAVASLYWLATFIVRNVQAHRHRLAPRGATHKPAGLGRAAGAGGVVEPATTTIRAPGTSRSCVAYAITLTSSRHSASGVMLRHARTGGFAVRLEDGSRLEVSPGPVRLTGPVKVVPAADAAVEACLDLGLSAGDDLPPVPYDEVAEIALVPGDRVRIHGGLDREAAPPEPDARGGPYRSTRSVLRPRGTPALAIVACGGVS
jgi:hypothetical protein